MVGQASDNLALARKFFFLGALILFFSGPIGSKSVSTESSDAPETVPNFNIKKYLGSWHQIAYIPNRFQSMCIAGTKAEYILISEARLKVINSCQDIDSTIHRAEGLARVNAKYQDPARLEVRFAPKWFSFLPFVWGDYWVLDIDTEYSSGLVGSPDRRYLWVLSRTREISQERYSQLIGRARQLGFDINNLVK